VKRAAADDEPVYLELADALELYAAIIGGTVSEAGDQLRNRSGLESSEAAHQARSRAPRFGWAAPARLRP
jgi:hypothetical protein